MAIGDQIKSLREQNKLDRYELAEKIGVSYHTIAKYESGERTPPPDILEKLADFFSVSVDALLGRDTDKPTKAVDDPEVQEFMKTVLGEFRMEKNIPEKAKQEILEDLAEYFKMKMNQAKRKAENK